MSMFDDVTRFLNSPIGRMIYGISKDALNNHIAPFMRESMTKAMNPVREMPPQEQNRRATEEFATINDFDIPADIKDAPEEDTAI